MLVVSHNSNGMINFLGEFKMYLKMKHKTMLRPRIGVMGLHMNAKLNSKYFLTYKVF